MTITPKELESKTFLSLIPRLKASLNSLSFHSLLSAIPISGSDALDPSQQDVDIRTLHKP